MANKSSSRYIIGVGEWDGSPERYLSRNPEDFDMLAQAEARPNRLYYPSVQNKIENGQLSDKDHPQNRIYLDGICQGPFQDANRKLFSLDHHKDCIYNITLSACEQAMRFTRRGTIGAMNYDVGMNHLDEDSVTAAYQILYADRMAQKNSPFFKRIKGLANLEGNIDVNSFGCEDFLDQTREVLEENRRRLDWIFEPLRRQKNGKSKKKDPLALVRKIFHRFDEIANFDEKITQAVRVNALDEIPISDEKCFVCVIASTGDTYSVAAEIQRREQRKKQKCACFLFHDGRTKFAIKLMDYVSEYRLAPIVEELNKAEMAAKRSSGVIDQRFLSNDWGGSDKVIGAPRYPNEAGPFLGYDTIKTIIADCLRRQTEENKKKRVSPCNGNGDGNGKPVDAVVGLVAVNKSGSQEAEMGQIPEEELSDSDLDEV